MNKYLLDTSAWIEYFKATKPGTKVKNIIENPKNECFYCNIIISELCSKTVRDGGNIDEVVKAIRIISKPAKENEADYATAGKLHGELRKKGKQISLADTIIATVAGSNKCKIVTKDFHLKDFNSVLLK